MNLSVRPYVVDDGDVWDRFCSGAVNSTLLHTRRFLSYHRDRFVDVSTIVEHDGEVVGLFPAARSLDDSDVVVSHPGATYGGVVHAGWLLGHRMISALDQLAQYYKQLGARTLVYKVLPYHYAQVPSQDDIYALHRLGAVRRRCELAAVIDLAAQRRPSDRRRRGARRAAKSVNISDRSDLLPALWKVVQDNLAREHGAVPVHTLDEMEVLQSRFPNEVKVRYAMVNGNVEAGVIFFNSKRTWHAQYIGASSLGHSYAALDLLFEECIRQCRASGTRYFDFGTSNEQGGAVLNDGLYRFKSEFGGGGVAHETYQLDLQG